MDEQELKSLFGRRVRDLRRREGYTQEKLAEAAKLSVEYVSKIERSYASPSSEAIARLVDVLDVDAKALFSE